MTLLREGFSMKTRVLILALVGLTAGCASPPAKEPPRAAAKPAGAAQAAPPAAPKVATKPVETPRVAADPLNDPNSPLARRSIYYAFDKIEIADQYKPLVEAHAEYLAGHHATKVRIEGNCDERGSREYNLALGQRRADSVKAGMKLLGVADEQIENVSWGEEKPRAAGHDEAAWAENRRSDIIYAKAR
jgi:peptidoglycan-associated lipoprotein